MVLAVYATDPMRTRGRFYAEPRPSFRSPFQRDRDRILHSTAFRRLGHKTQVFTVQEGDLFRTRLTHSIEVAQVARTITRALGGDEDLTEAIALAHDFGHPPFGHTGETALQEKMAPYGGFDHNAQAMRIVTRLERHYPDFDGLNLSWETLEGLVKHNGPVSELNWALSAYEGHEGLELSTQAGIEAQIAAIADDIAYNHHDLQDGLRSGLLDMAQVAAVPLVGRALASVDADYPELEARRRRYEMLSRLFGYMVEDVLAESQRRLADADPGSAEDVRACDGALVAFSESFFTELQLLRRFLFDNLYRHERVQLMRDQASELVALTFDTLMETPDKMPKRWQSDSDDETERARAVCDYLSGMTDRYILEQFSDLMPALMPVSKSFRAL